MRHATNASVGHRVRLLCHWIVESHFQHAIVKVRQSGPNGRAWNATKARWKSTKWKMCLTRAREGLRITRPGRGHIMPPAISAPRWARNTKLRGYVSPHKNSFWCKFRDLGSTFSRLNDVINATFSPFLVKRGGHRFRWPSTQTKTDSFNPKKKQRKHNELGYLQ